MTSNVLLALAVVAVQPAVAADRITQANRPIEIRFNSVKSYDDPFNQVTLDAVFTEPGGQAIRVPAFWAGDNAWGVRYASALTGIHRYRTECSDASNQALHGALGAVEVTPYAGDNPLYRHGPLRVAEDHRHFAHADGMPFFWLGDTWWMGLTRRLHWPDEFQQLAVDRRAKGFTVVQIVAGLYPDMPAFDERGLGDAGFPWETGYGRIRPEYFDAADQRIYDLIEHGLAPCIVGAWGYHLPWLGTDKMKQHWRNVIARWGALPVVWCAAGEQAMPWYNSTSKPDDTQQQRREWTDVIRFIRQTDPFHRLVTTHPRQNARDEVLDPTVLDFEMQQTGHGNPGARHAGLALEAWNRPPVMPVLSGESRYEALEINPPLGAREAREAFWAHLLNSGCAGHTYGANGIWQVNRADQRYGRSPGGNDWGGTPWNDAMRLPGSTQLASAKRLLLTLPWWRLGPVTNLVTGALSAAATGDSSCVLAYTTSAEPLTVDLGRLSGKVAGKWFDPTSGESRVLQDSPFTGGGQRRFTSPGRNAAGDLDWVLVLETTRSD